MFDFVPGPDSNILVYCVYVDARGEPSAGVTVRKLRQNPPFIGGARAAEIAPEPAELREASVELLRRARFHGMAFVEFKRDPRTGRYVFIEVNGRAVQFNSLLPPTGVRRIDADEPQDAGPLPDRVEGRLALHGQSGDCSFAA